jgi:hypothetical protein
VNGARVGAAALLVFALSPITASAQSAKSVQSAQSTQQGRPEQGAPFKLENNVGEAYQPITKQQRLRWFVDATIGPQHVGLGLLSAGYGTALDDPHEYRGTWAGFGKRFAVREAGVSLGDAMEDSLGSLWGEDPRYFRVPEQTFGRRVESVIKETFFAKYRDGRFGPAYARYAGIAGNNFISNAWRPRSEAGTEEALSRTGLGFLTRMAGNAFVEFWPDVRRRILHRP